MKKKEEFYKMPDKKTADVLIKFIPVKRGIRGKSKSKVDEVLIVMKPRKNKEDQ